MAADGDIRRVAGLMKIAIDGHSEHAEKVQAMIGYFEILDSAGVEDEEVDFREVPVSALRADEHVPSGARILDCLKTYRGAYVRAPGMS